MLLVQVGAHLDPSQRELIENLGVQPALVQPPPLSRAELAALYGRAALVLVPSEREGFGLPVLEALAAGAAVVASEIPFLREVAGSAVTYCPVADVEQWAATVTSLVRRPELGPSLEARRGQARRFTWQAHAKRIAGSYRLLARAA
jgi:glycosyltransferase involved in cell wall biosynthesis